MTKRYSVDQLIFGYGYCSSFQRRRRNRKKLAAKRRRNARACKGISLNQRDFAPTVYRMDIAPASSAEGATAKSW